MKVGNNKAESSPSPEWWQACYCIFFGSRPACRTSGHLALLTSQLGDIVYFADIEESNNHSEAHQRAVQEYADFGHPIEFGLRCVVYGPCRQTGCECAGEGCAMEFIEDGGIH